MSKLQNISADHIRLSLKYHAEMFLSSLSIFSEISRFSVFHKTSPAQRQARNLEALSWEACGFNRGDVILPI